MERHAGNVGAIPLDGGRVGIRAVEFAALEQWREVTQDARAAASEVQDAMEPGHRQTLRRQRPLQCAGTAAAGFEERLERYLPAEELLLQFRRWERQDGEGGPSRHAVMAGKNPATNRRGERARNRGAGATGMSAGRHPDRTPVS